MISLVAKGLIFSSILTRSPIITSKKLIRNENNLSWVGSVELWSLAKIMRTISLNKKKIFLKFIVPNGER